jgi:DNA repair protein RadD
MLVSLRQYQTDAVHAIREQYRAGKRAPLLVLSTGSGKTVIFCHITELMQHKGKRVIIGVHRQELLRQTSEHLETLGVRHGLIAAGHSQTGDLVQVASIQTLARRIASVPEPDLLVLDECHHANARTWRDVIGAWAKARLLGVTATPCRLDGTGLGQHAGGFFDALVQGPDIRWLIDSGYLAQPIVYAPPTAIDMSAVHVRGGDFAAGELEKAIDKPMITGCAVDHYRRICPGVPAIAFCASVKHADHVASEFSGAGIPSQAISGDLADNVRKHRILALASGEIRVLTSCDIISEGTDVPVVTAAILLRPTCSPGLYLQQVGRCLRPHSGKTNAIVLDHVGNCMRHGLPDDVRSWSLDGSKRKGKAGAGQDAAAKIRQCAACYAVFPAGLTHCPQCGAVVKVNGRELKHVDGELRLISREEIAAKREARREVGMAATLPELLQIAKDRGYKPGWAYIRWNLKQRKGSECAIHSQHVMQEAAS